MFSHTGYLDVYMVFGSVGYDGQKSGEVIALFFCAVFLFKKVTILLI
jgi:hypothetical protein